MTVIRRLLDPVALPPVGRVGPVTRALLAREILAAYVPLARRLRGDDVHELAACARAARGRTPVRADDAHRTALRLGKMVRRLLGVLPTDDRCLIRSLVLLRLLAQRGIDARLVIGVHSEGAFGAHAWVEHEGRPVLPTGRVARLVAL